MSNLTTLPKGDSAWLLRKSIQRIMQQVSVLETNIGSSTTGNSANTQVIFNDAGTLRGDTGLTYDKSADRLSFGAGICYGLLTSASATITGDLTVDTSTLKVDSANNRVGIGTASPGYLLDVQAATAVANILSTTGTNTAYLQISNTGGYFYLGRENSAGTTFAAPAYSAVLYAGGAYPLVTTVNGGERYRIASDGVATWSNVGGVAGTAMTLNSTGLGVGVTPSAWGAGNKFIDINSSAAFGAFGASDAMMIGNAYWDGSSWIRKTANNAWRFVIESVSSTPTMTWQLAANGSAGSSISSWTQAMTLDASGNVGIGVTPSAWLAAVKALDIGSQAMGIFSGGITHNAYFDNTDSRWEYKGNGAATYWNIQGGIHQWYVAASGIANNPITTFANAAMTLDASGNLLVGTTTNTNGSRVFVRGIGTSPALALQSATGDVAMPGLVIGKFDNNSTTSQIIAQFTINNGAAGSGQINANGASQAAFGSYSDSRLKENIISLPSQLANILSLRPVEFDYKDGSGHQIGFVAQEMQEVYSDAVGEQNGFLTVTGWSKTEARLVSAIKELAAKVQALEAKLA